MSAVQRCRNSGCLVG